MSKARAAYLFVTLAMTVVFSVQAGTGVASAQQTGAREVGEPGVAARAWALADLRSGEYLAGEDASIYAPYRKIPLASTNALLFTYGPATGIKTGTTPAAGESLVSSASKGDESYVCVVLDSGEDRFAASVLALRYGFVAYDRKERANGTRALTCLTGGRRP